MGGARLVFSVVPPRGRKGEFPVQPLDNGLEIQWQADFCCQTLTSLPPRSAGSRSRPCKVGKIQLIRFVIPVRKSPKLTESGCRWNCLELYSTIGYIACRRLGLRSVLFKVKAENKCARTPQTGHRSTRRSSRRS